LRVRERKHPKLYWIDSGLVRAIKKSWGTPVPEERGHLFEGLIAMLLKAYCQKDQIYDELFYWSPADSVQTEVDFLLRKDNEYLAIEVKAQARIRGNDLYGLKAISELKGIKKRLCVYIGAHKQKTEDGIEILPFDVFQNILTNNKLWH